MTTDAPTTNAFTMHSAREAMAGGLSHIEKHIKAIEGAITENPGYAFDLARTIVDSACKTILTERNITFGNDDDLPRLFRAVINNIPLLPVAESGEAEVRRSLNQTLNGLHTALQGVCELRNACGFASHGSDSPRPTMEIAQALLAAQAADSIVGFLHRVHRQERATLPGVQLAYEENESFNTYVDEANEIVEIFDLEYRPSEVLFSIDHEAYRDKLASFATDNATHEAEVENTGET